ncbi:hypothetical protein TL16_g09480 [Triparma laevis f. inornata]|uniref:HMG box domain-containing protein n=2 Tax=Triparma laevis TaxID=1534972 RepID=A0A9W7B3H8_9STRA|nr:hypothetical protein TrLO_g14970 [Triparma laevis f. longispina]GMH83088.1 hypothetical protein TL16_g09480 [Triparma laevis f. inornata]
MAENSSNFNPKWVRTEMTKAESEKMEKKKGTRIIDITIPAKSKASSQNDPGKPSQEKLDSAKDDPLAPKRPQTAYLLFHNAVSPNITDDDPEISHGALTMKVSRMWRAMPNELKSPFEAAAADNQVRFNKEMASYAPRGQSSPSISKLSDLIWEKDRNSEKITDALRTKEGGEELVAEYYEDHKNYKAEFLLQAMALQYKDEELCGRARRRLIVLKDKFNQELITKVKAWCTNKSLAMEKYGHISSWDVSNITNMYRLFAGRKNFNDDISRWDCSGVEDMRQMFRDCASFDGDLSSWNVENVTTISQMFQGASKFTGKGLHCWDVSNVTDMMQAFDECVAFNCDISKWNVEKVDNMRYMLYGAKKFNCDISGWDLSSVTMMQSMLDGVLVFKWDWSVSKKWNIVKLKSGDRNECWEKYDNSKYDKNQKAVSSPLDVFSNNN